ncbi:hypothetical protein CLV51_1021064 [Chitinophaga niastensis]|uniref:Uncharacterized protein n=1 Tax=Chitinophaga niastensis TaxID=536980 RepID=A0A2P8HPP1_CHINA|nr:hypothetical protein [Chitinophaga niastensis]PSL48200.1 hypothetical protein CLV51_1021064 [Chitinophaga niastensis]
MVTKISSLIELMQALAMNHPQILELQTSILCPYAIFLPPGYALTGADKDKCLLSFNNGDGIGITANNVIRNLTIMTTPSCRAIFSQTGLTDMGTVTLNNLSVTGQVSLMIRQGTNRLMLNADNVDVVSCDARRYSEQPQKYGVNVYQGAFTVYNFNGDPNSNIIANITNITVGRKNAPVIGSGIFVGGYGDNGGWVVLENLTTGAVYANGMLPYGTADIITGGVFIVFGVKAQNVTNNGEIVTYGVNDMVLDTWGSVDSWTVNEKLTSYGPSGIGFVNFGTVNTFIAKKEIITHGLGARGFNQYDGTVNTIKMKSITTYGDGAIGIQVSKPIGSIEMEEGITTHGSIGNTLVKGLLMPLPAIAFSIKPGGEVQNLVVKGDIITYGDEVSSYTVEGGKINRISVSGQVAAEGKNANAIVISNGGTTPLTNIRASSKSGKILINEGGNITDKSGFTEVV